MERKGLRSQLLTRLKCMGLYVFFMEGERMSKIFDVVLEKYRLFLLQRQQ